MSPSAWDREDYLRYGMVPLGLLVTVIAFPLSVGLHQVPPFVYGWVIDFARDSDPEGDFAALWIIIVVLVLLLLFHILLLVFAILECGLLGAGISFAYGFASKGDLELVVAFAFYSAIGGGVLLFGVHEYTFWTSDSGRDYAKILTSQAFYVWCLAALSIPGHLFGVVGCLAAVVSERQHRQEVEKQRALAREREEEAEKQRALTWERNRKRQEEKEEAERKRQEEKERERQMIVALDQQYRERREAFVGGDTKTASRLRIHEHYGEKRFRHEVYEFVPFSEINGGEAKRLGLVPVFTNVTDLMDWKFAFRRECRDIYDEIGSVLEKTVTYSRESFEEDLDRLAGENVQLYRNGVRVELHAGAEGIAGDFQSMLRMLGVIMKLDIAYNAAVELGGDLVTADMPKKMFETRKTEILNLCGEVEIWAEVDRVQRLIETLIERARRNKY